MCGFRNFGTRRIKVVFPKVKVKAKVKKSGVSPLRFCAFTSSLHETGDEYHPQWDQACSESIGLDVQESNLWSRAISSFCDAALPTVKLELRKPLHSQAHRTSV
jgi:hypothetical protein